MTNLTSVPSVVWRALSISEVLQIILCNLGKKHLFSCALVCRAWSPTALDLLWEKMDSAVDVFSALYRFQETRNSMGEAVRLFDALRLTQFLILVQDFDITHDYEPEPNAWLRFESYARRIKSFTYMEPYTLLTTPPPGNVAISDVAWGIIARTRTSMNIFPNLATIVWSRAYGIYGYESHQCTHIPLLLHPGIRSITAFTPDEFEIQGLWKNIAFRSPQLAHLDLRINIFVIADDPTGKMEAVLVEMLRTLVCLRSLILPPYWYTERVVQAISTHPDLHSMTESPLSRKNGGDPGDLDSFHPKLGRGCFPSLITLHVACSPVDSIAFFTSLSYPTNIRFLMLRCATIAPVASEIHKILITISTSLPHLTHLHLEFRVDRASALDHNDGLPISMDILEPAKRLSKLRSFQFHHQRPLESTIRQTFKFGSQLPSLRKLILNHCPFLLHATDIPTIHFRHLPMIVQECPHVTELGIRVQCDPDQDLVDTMRLIRLPETGSLRKLHLGLSTHFPDSDPKVVAKFLYHVCAPGCQLTCDYDWRPADDVDTDYDDDSINFWKAVADILGKTSDVDGGLVSL
jgi:hypothetical protein